MGSRYEGVLVRTDEAQLAGIAKSLLPLATSCNPPIRVTVVATLVARARDVWWLELVGVNKNPLHVKADPLAIAAVETELSVPSAWAKHLSLSATFSAARFVAGTLGEARYVFHSDGLSSSLSVRLRRFTLMASWSDTGESGSYDSAALSAIQDLLPELAWIDDFGDAVSEGRSLAWRLMDRRKILPEPELLV